MKYTAQADPGGGCRGAGPPSFLSKDIGGSGSIRKYNDMTLYGPDLAFRSLCLIFWRRYTAITVYHIYILHVICLFMVNSLSLNTEFENACLIKITLILWVPNTLLVTIKHRRGPQYQHQDLPSHANISGPSDGSQMILDISGKGSHLKIHCFYSEMGPLISQPWAQVKDCQPVLFLHFK